jgi:hypothetical protein
MISLEEAMGRSNEVEELRSMIEGRTPAPGGAGGVQGSPPARG